MCLAGSNMIAESSNLDQQQFHTDMQPTATSEIMTTSCLHCRAGMESTTAASLSECGSNCRQDSIWRTPSHSTSLLPRQSNSNLDKGQHSSLQKGSKRQLQPHRQHTHLTAPRIGHSILLTFVILMSILHCISARHSLPWKTWEIEDKRTSHILRQDLSDDTTLHIPSLVAVEGQLFYYQLETTETRPVHYWVRRSISYVCVCVRPI